MKTVEVGSVSKIVESEPNSRNRASKVTYIYALYNPESQMFVLFALRPTVLEIFHSLDFPIDSHVKISSATKV